MAAAISITKRIKCEINRSQIIRSTRYMKHQEETSTISLYLFHVTLYKQRDTNTCLIMRIIPKLFTIIGNLFFRQTIRHKITIFFLYSQHQDTAISVGKCRKRTPKRLRKATLSRFIFYFSTFLQLQSSL